jgi:hypothetical protein
MPDFKNFFVVNKNNIWMQNIQYTVLILKDRLIFVKTGGQDADTNINLLKGAQFGVIIGACLGGILNLIIEGTFTEIARLGTIGGFAGLLIGGAIGFFLEKRKKPSNVLEYAKAILRLKGMTEEQILEADKDNFVIIYEEISKLKIKKNYVNFAYRKPRLGILTIEFFNKKPQNYDISVKSDLSTTISGLLKALPKKFTVI